MPRKLLRLTAAAAAVGVAPITLKRWLLSGKVPEVARDRNDWRAFTPQDIVRIRRYARTLHRPEDE